MNLIIFDCDNTLWQIPYEEDGSFMDKPESLNFNFKYKREIVDIYKNRRKDSNNKSVILTNRIDSLESLLLEKLKKQDITFDYTLFRTVDRDKSHRLKDLLKSLPDVEEIEYYDDKEKHTKSINKLKLRFPNIKFKVNLVI